MSSGVVACICLVSVNDHTYTPLETLSNIWQHNTGTLHAYLHLHCESTSASPQLYSLSRAISGTRVYNIHMYTTLCTVLAVSVGGAPLDYYRLCTFSVWLAEDLCLSCDVWLVSVMSPGPPWGIPYSPMDIRCGVGHPMCSSCIAWDIPCSLLGTSHTVWDAPFSSIGIPYFLEHCPMLLPGTPWDIHYCLGRPIHCSPPWDIPYCIPFPGTLFGPLGITFLVSIVFLMAAHYSSCVAGVGCVRVHVHEIPSSIIGMVHVFILLSWIHNYTCTGMQ